MNMMMTTMLVLTLRIYIECAVQPSSCHYWAPQVDGLMQPLPPQAINPDNGCDAAGKNTAAVWCMRKWV